MATGKGLINDPFAEPLVRAAGVDYFIRLVDDARYAADDRDKNLVTGMIDVLATHTRFLDSFLADAGRAGIRQVVILASGMDTRPYRSWWPAGTTVYEIDQPEVIDFKSQVLRGLGPKLSANRRAVGIDLRQDWLAALRRVGFDASQRTVWIVENLLVGYLTPDWQNRLLHDVTAVSATGSRFAADHMSTWTPAQLQAGHAFVGMWRRIRIGRGPFRADLPGRIPRGPRLSIRPRLADRRTQRRRAVRNHGDGAAGAAPRRGDHPQLSHRDKGLADWNATA